MNFETLHKLEEHFKKSEFIVHRLTHSDKRGVVHYFGITHPEEIVCNKDNIKYMLEDYAEENQNPEEEYEITIHKMLTEERMKAKIQTTEMEQDAKNTVLLRPLFINHFMRKKISLEQLPKIIIEFKRKKNNLQTKIPN